MGNFSFSDEYMLETIAICKLIDTNNIENAVGILSETRESNGRLFIIGVGGSAATASHAVNDFRKICNIEAYSPVDNVPELTALTNDIGWEYVFERWLTESNINKNDTLLVFSVGGGNYEKKISQNIVEAINFAISRGSNTIGVVGRDGGHVARFADCTILIPTVCDDRVTPHVEGMANVILHLLVSHPLLKVNQTTWESQK